MIALKIGLTSLLLFMCMILAAGSGEGFESLHKWAQEVTVALLFVTLVSLIISVWLLL